MQAVKKIIIPIIVVIIISGFYVYSQPEIRWEVGKTLQVKEGTSPQVNDSSIKIETVATGINELTTFAFIGDDILYLEKINGDIEPRPFSEDFSVMTNVKPGCFVLMGNGKTESNGRPLHSADYDFNDELLVIGAIANKERTMQDMDEEFKSMINSFVHKVGNEVLPETLLQITDKKDEI